jgi:methionyl-tRNA formyltransferase
MNSKLDEGDVLLERSLNLDSSDDIGSILPRVNQEFASMSLECLFDFDNLFARRRIQNPQDAQFWLQRRPEDGEIRPEAMDAGSCLNLIRAVTKPYPGAFITIGDNRVIRIWRACMPDIPVMGAPGRIVYWGGAPNLVICRDKAIQILEFEASHL